MDQMLNQSYSHTQKYHPWMTTWRLFSKCVCFSQSLYALLREKRVCLQEEIHYKYKSLAVSSPADGVSVIL